MPLLSQPLSSQPCCTWERPIMKHFDTVLILGGAGLVGFQVAKRLAVEILPRQIVIASLYRKEATDAVKELRRLFPATRFVPAWGDIFRWRDPAATTPEETREEPSRADMLEDSDFRRAVFDSVYGDVETAYKRSELVQLILEHRPDVVIDAVNTATGLSYQDLFTAANMVSRGLDEVRQNLQAGKGTGAEGFLKDVETLVISQMVPQLVRHVLLLHRALVEARTEIYLKVGTTGTGGMGLNIPYTHGEDKPSPVLMAKNAVGFAHTGLLFLMARTPGSPVIKEIKPAAMIGYKDIGLHTIKDRAWERIETATGPRLIARNRQPVKIFHGREEALASQLDVEPQPHTFEPVLGTDGSPRHLQMVCVNTGENGLFARGEFTAITSLGQMEFVTAEEIADLVCSEVAGHNTGKDVIQALDSTIMGPTYRAGVIRGLAMQELARMEAESGFPSVAIGQLGPPQLAKYLHEAWLFKQAFGKVQDVIEKLDEDGQAIPRSPEELSHVLFQLASRDEVKNAIASIGIPILYPNGKTIYRGPFFRIPVYNRKKPLVNLVGGALDGFARRGWVDLRPSHMAWWQERFRRMRQSALAPKVKLSSEWATRELYPHSEIDIGAVVAWIFNNDEEIRGYRIK